MYSSFLYVRRSLVDSNHHASPVNDTKSIGQPVDPSQYNSQVCDTDLHPDKVAVMCLYKIDWSQVMVTLPHHSTTSPVFSAAKVVESLVVAVFS